MTLENFESFIESFSWLFHFPFFWESFRINRVPSSHWWPPLLGPVPKIKKNLSKNFGPIEFFGNVFLKLADFSLKKIFIIGQNQKVFRFLWQEEKIEKRMGDKVERRISLEKNYLTIQFWMYLRLSFSKSHMKSLSIQKIMTFFRSLFFFLFNQENERGFWRSLRRFFFFPFNYQAS